MSRAAAALLSVLSLSCGGAATLVLKSPIADRCQDAGLQDCDDLTEGVLLYVDGDKAGASAKIKKAASKNQGDQMAEFAAKLRLMKSIPGVESYVQPILQVADMIAPEGAPRATGDHPATASGASVGGADLAGTIVPFAISQRPCPLFTEVDYASERGEASCTQIGSGPLTLTDVETTGACTDTLIVGAGSPAAPRWALVAPPSTALHVHGAGYRVRAGERLFVGQVALSDARRDVRCAITWSATR